MAVATAVPTSSGAVVTVTRGPVKLMGWSVRKGAGACTVDLQETDGSGKIIASINLAATGGDSQWFGESGVICNSGVLYATVAGTTTGLVGSIWTA